MAGIIGIIDFNGSKSVASLLERMAETISHASWHRKEILADQKWGLGRVSLGIINPKPQPVHDQRHNTTIVLDGELYYTLEERKGLAGLEYEGDLLNDPELLLYLYEKHGDSFTALLNGAFAFALWDGRRERLLIATDRFGIRHLYYTNQSGRLIFGSEIKAILCDESVSWSVQEQSVAELLTFGYIIGDKTLFSSVRLLLPATKLIFDCNGLRLQEYWHPIYQEQYRSYKPCDYVEQTEVALVNAVRRRLETPHRIVIGLTSGKDSRLLLAAARQVRIPLKTLTFGIPGCDDQIAAESLARRLGIEHVFVPLTPEKIPDLLGLSVWLSEGNISVFRCQLVPILSILRQHCDIFLQAVAFEPLRGKWIEILRKTQAKYGSSADLGELIFRFSNNVLTEEEQEELFTPLYLQKVRREAHRNLKIFLGKTKALRAENIWHFYRFRQYFFRMNFHAHHNMRYGIEERQPMFDNELISVYLTIPPEVRKNDRLYNLLLMRLGGQPFSLKETWTKWIAGLLRPKRCVRKVWEDYPSWSRGPLWPVIQRELLVKDEFLDFYIRRAVFEKMLHLHLEGKKNYTQVIGILLTLKIWARLFLDKECHSVKDRFMNV